ncbi:unnamed protein product [Linum trigynum]|uniref:Uncharacterized protein n=1 Tax=Linum trigynum TaxID=586398 RepID=A0AAV2GW64_9ROSI
MSLHVAAAAAVDVDSLYSRRYLSLSITAPLLSPPSSSKLSPPPLSPHHRLSLLCFPTSRSTFSLQGCRLSLLQRSGVR